MKDKYEYIPVTPGDTPCTWLASKTEAEAIKKLMIDASHMPYNSWQDFVTRGYTIEKWTLVKEVEL